MTIVEEIRSIARHIASLQNFLAQGTEPKTAGQGKKLAGKIFFVLAKTRLSKDRQ